MPETATPFDALQTALSQGSASAALAALADQFRADQRYHDLFEALLMQARHGLGLPAVASTSLDDLPEPVRSQAEDAYMQACREVGRLLLAQGKYREAWMYLRPAGERAEVSAALANATPTEETTEEIIELALHEGLAPAVGFNLVLSNYGTCNSITTFEGTLPRLTPAAQKEVAEILVRHLHRELLGNVQAHVEDRKGIAPAPQATLKQLAADHPWLFANDSYHIDTSHLSSTVRFARLLTNPDAVQLALDLTEYGRQLSKQYQYASDEPFEDSYPSHGLLFAATVGERVDEALDYFRSRAEAAAQEGADQGMTSIETYLILLARLGRNAEAIEAWGKLVPPGAHVSPYAPRLLELAEQTGDFGRYLEICRERDDLLGYAAGLVAGKK